MHILTDDRFIIYEKNNTWFFSEAPALFNPINNRLYYYE